jgi:hypothetical protein
LSEDGSSTVKRSGLRVQVAGGILAALVSRIDEQAEAAKGASMSR